MFLCFIISWKTHIPLSHVPVIPRDGERNEDRRRGNHFLGSDWVPEWVWEPDLGLPDVHFHPLESPGNPPRGLSGPSFELPEAPWEPAGASVGLLHGFGDFCGAEKVDLDCICAYGLKTRPVRKWLIFHLLLTRLRGRLDEQGGSAPP